MKKAPAVLLVSGIGWIVFYRVGFTALGSSLPTIESSGQEVVDWFTDNGTTAQIYAWTAAFAALALTAFGKSGSSLPAAP